MSLMIGPTALLISPDPEDAQILTGILRRENWSLRAAHSLESAFPQFAQCDFRVVITEKDLRPGTWKDVWAWMQELEIPALLVVVSRHADGALWSEVLNLGAYDVLAKPFRASEVLHLLGHSGRISPDEATAEPARTSRRPAAQTTVYSFATPARSRRG
jgi:DNA-binding NtrC family response regulator